MKTTVHYSLVCPAPQWGNGGSVGSAPRRCSMGHRGNLQRESRNAPRCRHSSFGSHMTGHENQPDRRTFFLSSSRSAAASSYVMEIRRGQGPLPATPPNVQIQAGLGRAMLNAIMSAIVGKRRLLRPSVHRGLHRNWERGERLNLRAFRARRTWPNIAAIPGRNAPASVSAHLRHGERSAMIF